MYLNFRAKNLKTNLVTGYFLNGTLLIVFNVKSDNDSAGVVVVLCRVKVE